MLYVAFGLEILIMVGVPIAVAFWLVRRWRVSWGLIGAGALTFVISQAVHLPVNGALGLLTGGRGVAEWPLGWMALVAGLSAGVFEEGARYLILRFWRRDARRWREGVAFGVGHGGIESLLVGLLVLQGLVTAIAMRGQDLSALDLPPEALAQAEAQLAAFWATPWYLPFLGGLERLFALILHVTWAVLVLQALTRGNLLWLGVAVLGHALVDAAAVFLSGIGWPLWALELVIALCAAVGLWVTLRLRSTDGGARGTR
jgi:uncharacterized membrane protein YhfC